MGYRKTEVANAFLEYQRSLALYQLSLESRAFSAPQPLRADTAARALELERLPPGLPLRDAFARAALGLTDRRLVGTGFRDAGVALASIHNIGARGRQGFSSYSGAASAGSGAFRAHGDFWVGNVWVAADGRIWIHDPVVAKRRHARASELMSDPWSDLASFLFNLGVVHPLWLLPLIRQDWISECETAFLAGYRDEYRGVFDPSMIREPIESTFQDYAAYLSGCGRRVRSSIRLRYARRRLVSLQTVFRC